MSEHSGLLQNHQSFWRVTSIYISLFSQPSKTEELPLRTINMGYAKTKFSTAGKMAPKNPGSGKCSFHSNSVLHETHKRVKTLSKKQF